MPGWQREMREADFSARRIVRSVSSVTSPSSNALFGAAVTCLEHMPGDGVTWLWGDVIAQGKVTLLTGASGVGKSFVAMNMVAAITRGERDSQAENRGEPGEVLLISPEAELADVVRPRLQAAGAEMSRVHALRGIRRSPHITDDAHDADNGACRAFQLDEDLRLLEHEIAQRESAGSPLRLIVIDPFPVELFAYRYGTADLIRTMRYLAEIAAWSHVAILIVADNSTRLSGSWGNLNQVLHATAQSVWTVVNGSEQVLTLKGGRPRFEAKPLECPDPRVFFPYPPDYQGPRDDQPEPERDRLLLSVKANLRHKSTGLSFRLDDGRVEWNTEPVDMTADQYYAQHYDRCRSSSQLLEQEWSELARATYWLKRRLATGVTPLREIKRAAQEHDISFSTLRRAFCGLKGVARRIGNSRLWGWALPEHDAESGRLPAWLNVDEYEAELDRQARGNTEKPDHAELNDCEQSCASSTGASAKPERPGHTSAPGHPEASTISRHDVVEQFRDGMTPDESVTTKCMPDEVVELPNGQGWTWKSVLERDQREYEDELRTLAARETRLPDS